MVRSSALHPLQGSRADLRARCARGRASRTLGFASRRYAIDERARGNVLTRWI
jgi:hypothetical protein